MKEIGVRIKLRETSTAVEASLNALEIQDYFTLNGAPLRMLEPSFSSRGKAVPEMDDKKKNTHFLQVAVDLNPLDSPTPLDLRLKVRRIFCYFDKLGCNATVKRCSISSCDRSNR